MSMLDNPRAVLGGNKAPDYAKLEQERLADEYAGYPNTLNELVSEAETYGEIPDSETTDDEAIKRGALIKRFRDLDKRIEETRIVEGEPHLRRKNACDAFFKGLRNIIQPEDKRERYTRPGWIDKLQNQINVYQDRKEARERARLAAEAAEHKRLADEAAAKAQREADEAAALKRKAEDEAAAALRARNPERIEEKTAQAEQTAAFAAAAESRAVSAGIEAEQTREAATDARIATLAKPSDLVRARGVTNDGAGVTLTKAKEKYAIVVDRDEIDDAGWAKLGKLMTDDHLQTALNKFARNTNYRESILGCEIGERSKGVTR